jgi:hypothetical protein
MSTLTASDRLARVIYDHRDKPVIRSITGNGAGKGSEANNYLDVLDRRLVTGLMV